MDGGVAECVLWGSCARVEHLALGVRMPVGLGLGARTPQGPRYQGDDDDYDDAIRW